jgi:hypothetical protein
VHFASAANPLGVLAEMDEAYGTTSHGSLGMNSSFHAGLIRMARVTLAELKEWR